LATAQSTSAGPGIRGSSRVPGRQDGSGFLPSALRACSASLRSADSLPANRSNLRMPGPKPGALPLGYGPIIFSRPRHPRLFPRPGPAGWLGLPALGPPGLLRFAAQRRFAPGESVEPAQAGTKTLRPPGTFAVSRLRVADRPGLPCGSPGANGCDRGRRIRAIRTGALRAPRARPILR